MWKKNFMKNKIQKLNITKKEKESRINNLCSQLRKIKNDILNVENDQFKSNKYYHKWINEHKKYIIPVKKTFKKDNLYYDLQYVPQDYFSCMIFMMKQVEKDRKARNKS